MKKTKQLVRWLAIALAATWGTSQARAAAPETFTIGNGGLETFNLTWDSTPESGALAGGIMLTRVSGSIPTFTTVCTDIGGTVYLGYNYGYSAPTAFDKQDGIRPSWGAGNAGIALDTPWTSLTSIQQANATAAINAAADIFYNHQSVLAGSSVSAKAALQLAVWEALYDTTPGSAAYSLAAGRFSVSAGDAAATSTAADWLSRVNVNARYAGYLLVPTPESQYSLNAQEMFYNVAPVPEVTTLLAGGLLLLPFGASTLRTLRKRRLP